MSPTSILLVGPSQIGKDSLIQRLVREHGFQYHVNATTRMPRSATAGHQEYEFLTVTEFHRRVNDRDLVDWDYYAGNYYGVLPLRGDQPRTVMHCGAGMSVRISSRDPSFVPIFLQPVDVEAHRRRIEETFGPGESNRRLEMMGEELDHVPLFRHVVQVQDYASADVVVDKVVDIYRRVAGAT